MRFKPEAYWIPLSGFLLMGTLILSGLLYYTLKAYPHEFISLF